MLGILQGDLPIPGGTGHGVLPEGEKLVFLKITDPFFLYVKVAANLLLFAVPTILLYLLGVCASALVLWRWKKADERSLAILGQST